MNEYATIIGGADGPTIFFLAGELGKIRWLNIFGIIIIVLIMIPNIIYMIKGEDQPDRCENKLMIVLEQIGRYSCILLMMFNIGISELGFKSIGLFFTYLLGNIILIVSYWIIWITYFKNPVFGKQIALAIIPTVIFLLCGITMMHWLLIISGIIFGVGHIYVTYKNRV